MKELQSLGLDVKVMDEHDNEIEMRDLEDEDMMDKKVDLGVSQDASIEGQQVTD